eukprot:4663622-Pyramimonas_sp.AAC.1
MEIATNICHHDTMHSLGREFRGDPDCLPRRLRRILDGGHEHSSPNGQSYAKACSAWKWLSHWSKLPSPKPSLLSSWHGRMVPECSILVHVPSKSYMVVISQQLWSLF